MFYRKPCKHCHENHKDDAIEGLICFLAGCPIYIFFFFADAYGVSRDVIPGVALFSLFVLMPFWAPIGIAKMVETLFRKLSCNEDLRIKSRHIYFGPMANLRKTEL
jgi:hypothetical protein